MLKNSRLLSIRVVGIVIDFYIKQEKSLHSR